MRSLYCSFDEEENYVCQVVNSIFQSVNINSLLISNLHIRLVFIVLHFLLVEIC